MKRVYVVCATGVATSTMVRMKVEEFLRNRGIDADVTQYRVSELSADRIEADAIITTTGMPPEFREVLPVINGVALLTGIGEEDALESLASALTGKA